MEKKVVGRKSETSGHSIALRYEVAVQEEGGGAPSVAGVNKCFEMLDELIPQLGMYQSVMNSLRQDLYRAVYSSNWTSGKKRPSKSSTAIKLMPLPYFVIAQRLTERKSEEHGKLKTEISSLKEQLYTCEADLEKALSSLESYRRDLKDRDSRIHQLTSELHAHISDKEHLQEVLGANKERQEHLSHEYDRQIGSLQNTIGSLKVETNRLLPFKKTHVLIQGTKLLAPAATATTSANTMNTLEQHATVIAKLKFQLLDLQNSILDELDSWLQACYSEQSKTTRAEMVQKKRAFEQEILSLTTELSLLDQHKATVTGRLQELKSHKTTPEHTALVLPNHPLNPLIPQEQVSNKYAAMFWISSDGGKSFYPLKVAQHCASCGEKTVLCPHNPSEDEVVLQLPVNASHLKISRPMFRMTKQIFSTTLSTKPKQTAAISLDRGLHVTSPDFEYLWSLFKKKFPNFKLTLHRNIPKEQVLVLVEQLYATILLQDDRAALNSDEDCLTLPELLFDFIHQHYFVQSLTAFSCHAFISSLEEYCNGHKELLLVAHCLCGHLDGTAFRYMLLQASLASSMSWDDQSQLPHFWSHLYPFLSEEDVEQLSLNYIAYSDNRLSPSLILDFLQFILLRHKDPLVLFLEGQLAEHPCQATGSMLEVEFAEAMEKNLSINSDLLCRRLFLQSLALFQQKEKQSRTTLPTRNLAYIAAYVYRMSQSKLKSDLEKLSKNKGKNSPNYHSMDTVKSVMKRMEMLNCRD